MATLKVLAAVVNVLNDDLSVIDHPTFARSSKKHNRGVDAVVRNDGSKRQKTVSS